MIESVKQVGPALYRGPMPQSVEDLRALADKLGVVEVINLQGFVVELLQVKAEEKWAASIGMRFVHFPMDLIRPPAAATVKAVLAEVDRALVDRSNPGAVYLHCHDGVDRTGVVCMAYEIVCGSGFGAAVGRMIEGGFHLSPYQAWLHTLQKEFDPKNRPAGVV